MNVGCNRSFTEKEWNERKHNEWNKERIKIMNEIKNE